MIPGARPRGARKSCLAVSLAAASWLAFAASAARAAVEPGDGASAIEADVALAGSETAVERVRSVVAELLQREGVVVATSRLDRIRSEVVLTAPAANERRPIGAWIDLGSTREVLLYFRDAAAQRFVLRRLALDNGLDEVAVEEVGHIVKSVVLALAAGNEPALTIAQARAMLQPEREAPKPQVAEARRGPRVTSEVTVGLVGQLFSPAIPLSPRLDLTLALLVDDGGSRGPLGGWLSVGDGQTLHYRDPTIGIDLATVAVRAGALWQPWRSARVVTRVGAGGGFDLIDFTPQPASSGVAPAAAGRFLAAVGTLVAGVQLKVLGPLSVGAGAEIDLYAADVHYDVQRTDGRVRLLVPYRVRPGLALTVSALF
jgi:hypothetical protein